MGLLGELGGVLRIALFADIVAAFAGEHGCWSGEGTDFGVIGGTVPDALSPVGFVTAEGGGVEGEVDDAGVGEVGEFHSLGCSGSFT
jgi:hypothetical protein